MSAADVALLLSPGAAIFGAWLTYRAGQRAAASSRAKAAREETLDIRRLELESVAAIIKQLNATISRLEKALERSHVTEAEARRVAAELRAEVDRLEAAWRRAITRLRAAGVDETLIREVTSDA